MKLEVENIAVWVFLIVWMKVVEVHGWAGGFGDRCPDSKIDEIDDIGKVPKTCFDIIDSYGDCLLDDMILPESMCRSVFGSKTYEKMLKEQDAINKKYAMFEKKNYYTKKKYYKKKLRDNKYRGSKGTHKKYGKKKDNNKDLNKKKYTKKKKDKNKDLNKQKYMKKEYEKKKYTYQNKNKYDSNSKKYDINKYNVNSKKYDRNRYHSNF